MKKGTGRDLFEYYVSQCDEYSRDLLTAHTLIGDDLFPMLERCEKSSQKIKISESGESVLDPDMFVEIV